MPMPSHAASEKKLPKPPSGPQAESESFGVEGSNKTLPTPQDGAVPAPELQGTKTTYVPKTPYTRG